MARLVFSLVQNIKLQFSKIDLFPESQMQKALFGSSTGQMFFFWMAIGKRCGWIKPETQCSVNCIRHRHAAFPPPYKPYKSRQITGTTHLVLRNPGETDPLRVWWAWPLFFTHPLFFLPSLWGRHKKSDYACLENMKSVRFFVSLCFGISVRAEITTTPRCFLPSPCFLLFNRSTNICDKFSV